MKTTLTIAALMLGLSYFPAMAGSQQDKMKDCAASYHAKAIPKSEYKSFMSECLKKDSTVGTAAPAAAAKSKASTKAKTMTTPVAAAVPAKVDQKSKMKTCNETAKKDALKGDARKAFMKTCLSNK